MDASDLHYLLSHVGTTLPAGRGVLAAVTVRWHDGDGYSVDSSAADWLRDAAPHKFAVGTFATVRDADGYEHDRVQADEILHLLRVADVQGAADDHQVAVNLISLRAVVLTSGQDCPAGYRHLDEISRRELVLRLMRS